MKKYLLGVVFSAILFLGLANSVLANTGDRGDYLTGGQPFGVAFDAVTNSVWVTNYNSNTVSKMNVFNGTKIDYPTGNFPYAIAFDPVTNSMWITNTGSGTVSKMNIFDGTRIDYSAGNGSVQGIAFDPVTNSMWVTNIFPNINGIVSKINIFNGNRTEYPTGNYPYGIAFDSVTNSVWITNRQSSTVSKMNIFNGTKIDYPTIQFNAKVFFDPVTNSVWITNAQANTVSKMNIFNGTKIDYPTGATDAFGIVFDPVTNSVWITNTDSNNVTKMDVYTGSKINYPTGAYPFDITFDPVTNSVWIANNGSNTVSKMEIRDSVTVANVNQFKPDQTTTIAESGTTAESNIFFKGTITDINNDTVKLQVELRKTSDAFTGLNDGGIIESGLVSSGSEVILNKSNLADGSYHWRYRGVNSHGNTSSWQEFGTPGNIDFTIHTRNPLILIPGILGTKLTQNYGNHDEVWPNLLALAGPFDFHLDPLMLSGSGEEYPEFPITVGDIITSINIPVATWWSTDIFDSLITDLTSNGYTEDQDLFVFPYDWRKDNAYNAERLNTKINEILGNTNGKVDIIAHSMGGLVAKDYIASNGSSKIDKLIFVGTPHDGSPQSFKVLMYDDNLGIPVLNQHEAHTIVQNMPSVYQLLPSQRYVDANNHKYVLDLATAYENNTTPQYLDYADTRTHMINSGRNSTMFPMAESLHSDIDNMNLSGVDSYNFVGCGLGTTAKIVPMKKEIANASGVPLFIDSYGWGVTAGDTTVPTISSTDQVTSHTYYVNKIQHGNLPSANGVHQTILSILSGQTPGTFNNISTSSTICTPITGDVVSVHSPVELHIYDSQNRHTGPVSNGDIEYGIPGVTYERLGEDKFAYLPEGETYTVKNEAITTGEYTLQVQKVENEEVTETTSFNNIPIPSEDSHSTIEITGQGQTTFNLQIDNNGDNTYESTITPTSTLDETESADITRPQTTVSVSGTQGANGWYTSDVTVTLNATDDNSGVLKTMYSKDNGTTWQEYISPFAVTSEAIHTIKYFSTDKMGNIEAIKSVIVKIDKTAPEAEVYFDPATRYLAVAGGDNLSIPTVTKVNSENYTVTDGAGHTAKINLKAIYLPPYVTVTNAATVSGASLDIVARTVKYDSGAAIILPKNNLHYEWTNTIVNGTSKLKTLVQSIRVPQRLFTGIYDPINDDTKIIDDTYNVVTFPGLAVMQLRTEAGDVVVDLY